MAMATMIIKISNEKLSIISTPNKGKDVRNNGNNAQWMAQATEAVIPNASQFIFIFIEHRD